MCVVPVGAFSKFGRPAPEVMARFGEAGARVYRTDECDAVVVRSRRREGSRRGRCAGDLHTVSQAGYLKLALIRPQEDGSTAETSS